METEVIEYVNISAVMFGVLDDTLAPVSQTMYETMTSAVTSILAAVVTLALIYRWQFVHMLGLVSNPGMATEGTQEMMATLGRVIFVTAFLASYGLFTEWIMEPLITLISGFSLATFGAFGVDKLDSATDTRSFVVFASNLENLIYGPAEDLVEVWRSTSFGITNVAQNLLVGLIIGVIYFMAFVNAIVSALFLFVFNITVALVSGLGPLALFLWVFDTTRPYAWAFLKTLIGIGAVVMVTVAIAGIATQIGQFAVETLPVQQIRTETGSLEPVINVETITAWLFSRQSLLLMSSYATGVILQIVFAWIAFKMVTGTVRRGV